MDSRSPTTLNGDSPLHVAVRQGQVEDVREILIQQQVDVNILNSKHETPLHLACSKNDSPIVQLLLAFGADPLINDSNNKSAYDRSDFDVCQLMDKLLFGHGLRLWIDGPMQADKESPLHTAIRLERLDDIQRIIEEKIVDINDTNADHEIPLHLACALGNKYIVHILISNGADIYMKNFFNNAPIHRAVSQGQIDTVDYLITVCACNPNIKGYQGRTLLHFACGIGNVKFATTLIENYGISPMATDAVNQTPLHIAASHGQEEVVRLLINKYSSLESTDLWRLLRLACSCGHVSVVRTLVLKYKAYYIDEIDVIDSSVMGGSIEMVQPIITEFDLDDDGNTPLHMACLGGHEELARLLITNYDCPVDVKNEDNETPLHKACLSGRCSIVRMLISEFKADATQRDHYNDTAVSKAAEGGHVETVQALLTELGCNPKVTGYDGRSLLHEACWNGSIKLAEMLIIEFSLDIFLADDNGDTPLHMACEGGHEELARLLITKYNCPVDVKSNIQETPLHTACSSGHSSIVRMLISEFKADATQRDHYNDTAVSKAAEGGHVETVQVLISELGCSPKVAGYDGRSLLHEACRSGNIKLAEILIVDFSLDIFSADDSGNTPLHMACCVGHEELVRLLITKYNCPVDVENKIQKTPVHYAHSNGHSSIVRMLLLTMEFQYPKTFNGDNLLHIAVSQGQIKDVREILIQQQVDVNILNSKNETPLHLGCSKRDSPIVQLLVAFGADPLIQDSNYENAYDRSDFDVNQLIHKLLYSHGLRLWIDGPVQADKESPLHTAVRLGRLDDIQKIIEEKIIDINDTNVNHETPLHLSCALGHKHIVHILISNGADIYMKDFFNNAPIHRAVSQGHIDTVDYLITLCACNPNIKGYQGRTLLHFACAIGNIKLVTTLIEKYGISPMATDAVNQTPLHIAASHGQEEVVRLLITNYNLAVDCRSNDKLSPLHLACYCGHVPLVITLVLEYKADINKSAFRYSLMGGSIEMVQLMITEFDLDPLSVNGDGDTPLHMACEGGHEELARLLITNYNCPVDIKNRISETPLHCACLSGHYSIVRMLISEFKADVTQRDLNNDTAVSKAAEGGHVETVQALLTELGCSPKITGYDGGSLLHEACRSGSIKLAEMLIIDFSLDIFLADDSGNTPLHMACLGGHEELARLLITNYNCPVYIKNKAKKTPLHMACSHGYFDVSKVLVSDGNKGFYNTLDKDSNTPLDLLIKKGDAKAVHVLSTEYGFKPHVRGIESKSLLHQLAAGGFTTVLQKLISNFNYDPASSDEDGNTILHTAAQHGQYKMAKLLIAYYSNQCPIYRKNSQGQTALHCACIGGHTRVAEFLIANKADITVRDEDGDTPLKKAFLKGHLRTCFKLFGTSLHTINHKLLDQVCERGSADLIDILLSDFNLDPFSVLDHHGNTAIHIAAVRGHKQVVSMLVTKYSGLVHVLNRYKQTPLHMACSCGHLDVSKMLLSGADEKNCNSLDKGNNTPLDLLIQRGDAKAVHILYTEYGCKLHVRGVESKSLLHQLAARGFITMLQKLISKFNYDPACTDEDNTLLHIAVQHGQYEVAKLLIADYSNQCQIDHRNSQGQTALHCACMCGHARIVKFIANKILGDKLALVDECGNTLLHIAAQHGQYEVAKLLIADYSNQCQIDHRNSQGQTALHCACMCGHARIVKFIANKTLGDNLALVDECGNTLLHIAAQHGQYEVAKLLIARYGNQCPIDHRNSQGQTALHCACIRDHTRVAKFLVASKADITIRDEDGDTPLKKAFLTGHKFTLFELFNSNLYKIDGKLLQQVCEYGSVNLIDVLLSDFQLDPSSILDDQGNKPIHIAALRGHKQVVTLLIKKYKCPVDVKNEYMQTPLHLACSRGQLDVSIVLVSECILEDGKRFYNALDKDNNTPLDLLIKKGDTNAVHILSTEHGLKPHVRGVESKPLLHQLADGGFTTMLQELISKFNHDPACTDEDGNTVLHTAAQHAQYEVAEFLIINYSDQFPIDHRNNQGQTALHCACMCGHTRVAKFLIANKADITVRDEDGDTPLKKAFLTGHELIFFELFDSNLRTIDSQLLQQVCKRGSIDLIDILLSNFHLDPFSALDDHGNKAIHIAVLQGHKQVVDLLIKKYKCPIDSRNLNGQTPLHLICSQLQNENVHALIRMCVLEFKADVSPKDANDDQPIHVAVQAGHTSTVISLILDYHVSLNSRGFKKWSLLHHALANGHTSTAKTLIDDFHLSLHCVDEDGNTPLHLSSLVGQTESLKFLLYEYHAPLYVRNKAGKTALDLATEDFTKKVIREYVKSEHKRIQREYDKLRAKSLQKYSGQQIITRVFVLGNPGSGKSTLIESLKRKGLSYYLNVPETDVKLHTAGIIPSTSRSSTSQYLYYDFAGDQEYFSSHAAILETVSRSTVGSNVFLIVTDLTKGDTILQDEIGYWLSFISYHGKALDSQCKLKVIVVLSHLDQLSGADSDSKVDSVRQCLQTHTSQCNEVKFNIEIVSSNCRSPRSSKSIESVLQQMSKDTPPCSISYEASLLHGILEKDFGNVVACKFQNLLSSIEETGIYLPSSADALHPIVRELHDIGLLMLIGRSEDELENYLLLLNSSSLTNEVHEKLFSNSAIKKLRSPGGPHFASMGILPESYLASILPQHITKECLVQLQYCQEFTCADIECHPSEVSNSISARNLLYFPALCELDSEQSNWPTDPLLNFSIGWYAKCTGKFDYFPARFLHVLLLRLAFAFALPIANCHITESNEISAQNRRCTMWKNGIRWLMEDGVECIFEMVNDNKGIVVITKAEEGSKEWENILSDIINKTLQAKAEFCSTVSLYHFLLKSDDIASFKNNDKLFKITEIESVIKEGKKKVVSVSGRTFLDSSYLDIFRKYTFGGEQ